MKETLDKLDGILKALTFYESIRSDVHRIIGLVQDNQEFFGNPPAGQSCIKVAADKLEQLIKGQKGQ